MIKQSDYLYEIANIMRLLIKFKTKFLIEKIKIIVGFFPCK